MPLTYKSLGPHAILRSDGVSFPLDPGNNDYQRYQEDVAAGAVLAPADPVPADQAAAAELAARVGAGCAVTSATRAYLNGTYGVDQVMQDRVEAIADGIANGKGFPHGAQTFNWPVAGGVVTFKSTADAVDVFAALRDYVSDLIQAEAAAATGNAAQWPAQPVVIA